MRASTGGVLATKSERKMLASTWLYSLYAWFMNIYLIHTAVFCIWSMLTIDNLLEFLNLQCFNDKFDVSKIRVLNILSRHIVFVNYGGVLFRYCPFTAILNVTVKNE